MKIKYINKNFRVETELIIDTANSIIAEYEAQGYDLTLRQLYYQFVARDIIPNTMRDYKRLGAIINDARLAGLVDWDSIEDRTRNLKGLAHWKTPSEIIEACVHSFKLNRWTGQDHHVEVWIEKDALIGVISRICNQYDVSFFSCRGYVSQSEMHGAAMRFRKHERKNQSGVLVHLGDHDPSGIDMTRDIENRFLLFGAEIKVERIALNMNQVEELSPPPNPAKLTDTRSAGYINRFGPNSWELDALEPSYIEGVINQTIEKYIDQSQWAIIEKQEDEAKSQLHYLSEHWSEIAEENV